MSEDLIDYGKLIDDAMHLMVCRILKMVQKEGLKGNHHFFISFSTNYPGVQISPKLHEKYPQEITIVLQYQYEDLAVEDNRFSVSLSFDNIKEKIVVPFDALTAFADPSVKFGLQFRHIGLDEYNANNKKPSQAEITNLVSPDSTKQQNNTNKDQKNIKDNNKTKTPSKSGETKQNSSVKDKKKKGDNSNVIRLDSFRDK